MYICFASTFFIRCFIHPMNFKWTYFVVAVCFWWQLKWYDLQKKTLEWSFYCSLLLMEVHRSRKVRLKTRNIEYCWMFLLHIPCIHSVLFVIFWSIRNVKLQFEWISFALQQRMRKERRNKEKASSNSKSRLERLHEILVKIVISTLT